ncbi:hypothetical protein [Lonsdalea populi]|uniref:hypothetical protein n=1 Tax=Lonsdalea populi TaxID=1172565 RepID=UPI0015EC159A|nr:hypothetical protein [Lonsdalea populi]
MARWATTHNLHYVAAPAIGSGGGRRPWRRNHLRQPAANINPTNEVGLTASA